MDKSSESEKPADDPVPPTNQGRRPSAFSRLSSYTSAMSTTKSSLSSDSNSDSPKTLKKYIKAYAGTKFWSYLICI